MHQVTTISSMNDSVGKPRLVFFHSRYDVGAPPFLVTHKDEHVKCLSEFFDVVVIDEDCDYQQVCDAYEPDLALFEIGLQVLSARKLAIARPNACASVPKVAFLNADPWGATQACLLSQLDHFGIETAFSHCTTAAEHLPAIADRLFTWPNFINPQTYRDYGQPKLVPVILTGCQDQQYPWRHKVYKILANAYPSFVCPHLGYNARLLPAQMMFGESYARALNSAWFAPTCGTVAREAVRKHFEIPGSNACLITEASPALTAAGFVDMQNCVFADEHDVLDKVAYLVRQPDRLKEITDAGYQLVHGRHTLRHRDQIFQWFRLFTSENADQKIIQTNPFAAPVAVERTSNAHTVHIRAAGLHLALCRDAEALLWAGRYAEAERSYAKCLNYVGSMAEPKFRIALCNLYKGDPKAALSWIVPPLKETIGTYGAANPDPVQWAYLIICLLCLNRLGAAAKRASQFPDLHHPELDRARFAVAVLTGHGAAHVPLPSGSRPHASLHELPARDLNEWIEQLCTMLRACGRPSLAQSLTDRVKAGAVGVAPQATTVSTRAAIDTRRLLHRFDDPLLVSKLRDKLTSGVLKRLHRLEAKYGFFLPYRLSALRSDEFFEAILRVIREEPIATALVIGAHSGKGATEAFLAGASANPNQPTVFCISSERRAARGARADDQLIRWHSLSPSSADHLTQDLDATINAIIAKHGINAFDAVLVDGAAFGGQIASRVLTRELQRAALVLLDDTSGSFSHRTRRTFLDDARYALVADNPELRNGYAVFQRQRSDACPLAARDVELTEAYG
jgi:hypothetical protein